MGQAAILIVKPGVAAQRRPLTNGDLKAVVEEEIRLLC